MAYFAVTVTSRIDSTITVKDKKVNGGKFEPDTATYTISAGQSVTFKIVNFDDTDKFSGSFNLSVAGSTPIACNFQLDETHQAIQCVPGVGCKYVVDPPPTPTPSETGFNFTLKVNKAK